MNRQYERGFTLIELMIVVAIVGVLAVLAVGGVRKYVANAKTAEARATVGQMGRLAMSAFERESSDTTALALGSASSAYQHNLCATSSRVPAAVPSNKKYQSQYTDWNGDQTTGWRCLKFTFDGPQYFQYYYAAPSTAAFTANAYGDLNGDSVTSTFTLAGSVDNGQAHLAPSMIEVNAEE